MTTQQRNPVNSDRLNEMDRARATSVPPSREEIASKENSTTAKPVNAQHSVKPLAE